MSINYKDNSNYSNTNINRKYLETYVPKLTRESLSQDTRTMKVESKYERRPDLLAYDLFGNANLWWVIAHYNREVLKDPLNDFIAGIEIEVPTSFRNFGSR